jgi:hypothetical protein
MTSLYAVMCEGGDLYRVCEDLGADPSVIRHRVAIAVVKLKKENLGNFLVLLDNLDSAVINIDDYMEEK